MSDNELIMRIAAAIQKRSIARSGSALSGEICLDYATAALTAYDEYDPIVDEFRKRYYPDEIGILATMKQTVVAEFHYVAGDGIGRTDLPEVCGELSDGA